MKHTRPIFRIGGTAALLAALYGCGGTTVIQKNECPPLPDAGITMPADSMAADSMPEQDASTAAQCRPLCGYTQSIKFVRPGDVLTLNKLLGDVVASAMDDSDAPALGTYDITNAKGLFRVQQYLQFTWAEDNGQPKSACAKVIFGEDEDGNVGDYLWFHEGEPAFKYSLLFTEVPAVGAGLRSGISSDGRLDDIVGISLEILGEQFLVNDAELSNSGAVRLEMTGCASGKTVVLKDAYPGAWGGRVAVDGQDMDDDVVHNIDYAIDADGFWLKKIEIKLMTDGADNENVYIAPGEGLKQHLDKPEAMISSLFDIVYQGLFNRGSLTLQDPLGDDLCMTSDVGYPENQIFAEAYVVFKNQCDK